MTNANGRSEAIPYFEFTDTTTKLRRNLLALVVILAVLMRYGLKVGEMSAGILKVEGLMTERVMAILSILVVYHLISFFWNGLDEYRHWRLTFLDQKAGTWENLSGMENVVAATRRALDTVRIDLEAMSQSGGFDPAQSDTPRRLLANMADVLRLTATFRKGLRAHSRSLFLKFWLLELGPPVALSCVVLGFYGWYHFSLSNF